MLGKNELKYYSSLLRKKQRDIEGKFIVEGKRLLEEALSSKYVHELICCTESFAGQNISFINKINGRLETVKEAEFRKLSDTQHPQGIMGVFHKKKKAAEFKAESGFIVGLEDLSDPGNLGTIFRSCDWFGIKQILLSSDCAEVYNPKVLRASMGAVFHTDFYNNVDFYNILEKLKDGGYKILCADMEGESIYKFDKPQKYIIVLSNEAHGPSEKIKQLADTKLTIPGKGKTESLNVASASAVILSELTKDI